MSANTSPSRPTAGYQYCRLSSPRSVRLLTLLPSPSLTAALELTLTEASLESITSQAKNGFEALSYVWGARVGTVPISCDGQQLLVTPNCESALRHLRLAGQDRVLWVDAICIDQGSDTESVKERNTQVALMGEIYQKAARTLCWLGPGNDFTTELMAHLERIGSCPSQRALKKLLLFDSKLRQQGKIDSDSSALNHIFCHIWHSRIWTVQEASFSRDCHVVCGKCSIPWDIYFKAARFLVFEEFIDELDTQAQKSYIGIDVRNTLRDYLLGRVPSEPDPSAEDLDDERDRRVVFLSSCLAECKKFQATEPRDRIYGLHALYTSLGIQLPAVEYSKPLWRVYEEAAVAMIMWSQTLKVLGDACHDHPSFPSWVPDFSDADVNISTPSGDATGGSKITVQLPTVLNPRPGELCVRGKVVGRVVTFGGETPATTIFPTRPEQCELGILTRPLDGLVEEVDTLRLLVDKIRFFRQLYRLLQDNTEYCSGDAEDTFLDLLSQDSYSEPSRVFNIWLDILEYPDTNYSLRAGEDLVAKWQRAESTAGAAGWTAELTSCAIIAASLVSNQIQHDGGLLDCTSDILNLLSQLSTNLNDKSLILVRLDSLQITALATGVASVQEGDSVALLEGAEWPVVLREAEERKWHFVGPTFVPGIMDGELWQDEIREVGGTTDFCDFCLI
ncbi:hypothetical protein GGS23DRAFT_550945 [Durotheca rogersii]|uniref:uncharacterized protein n=1 Tax=Durotheca rogersii TaxID=419775 RepID=UPI002220A86D|nr:uncharacterized protein GGS23DRAFT_550945 [Durotheca rogersii]KAI5866516.1 hypothetical protein GGS23DRAFT_550945 [Durotheca rogersii]